ncbi:Stage III sporulation protein E [Sedimentisphaera cyanobacteriorum]|uniref:Stage III sporulation protein E n=1 Tax=Sedimentisphaera cyanobacteriorum TaxID=1940790 RepID=A0A1Q2HQS8_9BACT|nr:DNA translocase FtsK [Sedimentisphaera cyanobacteriorum]AQQ09740.1 Stage III sporulation protein E [Sedimentisphaera cyanobacteriorum]
MTGRELLKIAAELLIIVLLFLAAASCVSFDIYDPPGGYSYPLNDPPANWLNLPGAYFSHYALYYIGPGIYVILGTLIFLLASDMFGRPAGQIPFRIAGMLLLCAAVSAAAGCYSKFNFSPDAFPVGRAGVLGTFLAEWLGRTIGQLGRFAIMLAATLIGLIFIADSLVAAFFKGLWGFLFSSSKKPAKNGKTKKAARKLAKEETQTEKAKEKKAGFFAKIKEKKKAKQQEAPQAAEDEIPIRQEEPEKTEKKERKEFEISRGRQDIEPYQLHPEQTSESVEIIPDPDRVDVIDVSSSKDPEEEGPEKDNKKNAEAKKNNKPKKKSKPSSPEDDITEDYKKYVLPHINLLEEPEKDFASRLEVMVREKADRLQETLDNFKVDASVINAEPGPTITLYEIELSAGMRVNKISNLADDIARALAVPVVRVVSPLPGKDTIGIEVPNSERETVRLKDLIQRAGKVPVKMKVPIFLGKDSSGSVLVADLADMPHGLIAGTTGSGKSVCINTIITSILLTRKPNEVKLVLIDPKQIEMTMFEGLAHLMCPIVSDMNQSSRILEWAVGKMEERYAIFNEARVKNISEFNELSSEEIYKRLGAETPEEQLKVPERMPYLVLIVDELSDLMMTNGKEVEEYVVRLTQKSRAAGIHVILATQRPQASVVTGLIKSNLPGRISFKVASRMDSRIILDKVGAETLLGKGDMLYLHPKTSELIRAQGAFLSNEEISRVVTKIREQAGPNYSRELVQLNKVSADGVEKDEYFDEAVRIVLATKRGSVSLLQRKLAIGYGRASRIVDMMAESGIIGEHKNAQAREVLITPEEWERIKEGDDIADIRSEDQQESEDQPSEEQENASQEQSLPWDEQNE